MPLGQELKGDETASKIPYCNLRHVLSSLEKGKKHIVYVMRITQMKELIQYARDELGFSAEGVCALKNEEHPMSSAQIELREFIIDKQCLPEGLEILFINKSLERCINIRGDIASIVVHSSNEDTIIQARGRYRAKLDVLYVYAPNSPHLLIPEKFLDRPLYAEDKQELAAVLNWKKNGRRCKFETIEKRIKQECHYSIIYPPKSQTGGRITRIIRLACPDAP